MYIPGSWSRMVCKQYWHMACHVANLRTQCLGLRPMWGSEYFTFTVPKACKVLLALKLTTVTVKMCYDTRKYRFARFMGCYLIRRHGCSLDAHTCPIPRILTFCDVAILQHMPPCSMLGICVISVSTFMHFGMHKLPGISCNDGNGKNLKHHLTFGEQSVSTFKTSKFLNQSTNYCLSPE